MPGNFTSDQQEWRSNWDKICPIRRDFNIDTDIRQAQFCRGELGNTSPSPHVPTLLFQHSGPPLEEFYAEDGDPLRNPGLLLLPDVRARLATTAVCHDHGKSRAWSGEGGPAS